MKRTILTLGVFFLSTALASVFWPPATAQADMIGVGEADGPLTVTEYIGDGEGWTVDDPGSPDGNQVVYYDPSKGPWVKKFAQVGELVEKTYTFTENLSVGDRTDGNFPNWANYRQEIETLGWSWTGTATCEFITPAGGSGTCVAPIDGNKIDWSFQPLLPVGTQLTITAYATFDPAVGDPNVALAVSPHPMVPEPGTFVLMATGLLTIVGYAWRRRRRNA